MTRTNRCFGFLTALLLCLGIAPRAQAELNTQGNATLSIDRLFGFSHTQLKQPSAIGSGEMTSSRTDVTLLAASNASVYTTPRLAADFNIADGFTVGGSVAFLSVSRSSSVTSGSVNLETDGEDNVGFLLAPRAGFVLPIAGPTYLWLRGGFTYFQMPVTGTITLHGFSFNLEPTMAFMLAGQLGITMSGLIDLPIAGEAKFERGGSTGTTDDVKLRNLGLVVGIAVTL